MNKNLRLALTSANSVLGTIRKTITRGQLVALFVLLAMAAMIFVSMRPSSANSAGATASKSRSASGDLEAKLFELERNLSKANVRQVNADGPSLTTDKASYLPGETITLTGADWTAGEAVTIVVSADSSTGEAATLQATADDSGSFTATY